VVDCLKIVDALNGLVVVIREVCDHPLVPEKVRDLENDFELRRLLETVKRMVFRKVAVGDHSLDLEKMRVFVKVGDFDIVREAELGFDDLNASETDNTRD
jgi:hypothetical protein